MKITEYARKVGVTPLTARKWFHDGIINGAYQMPSGTIIVPDDQPVDNVSEKTVIYARVSSSDQKKDLDAQAKRLTDYATAKGWTVDNVVKEIASGVNDHRAKLLKVLEDESVTRIVVEHKDRLTIFGFNYLSVLLKQRGTSLIVVNHDETANEDIVSDFVSIITSFCARIYGSRRGKRKTEMITKELEDASD